MWSIMQKGSVITNHMMNEKTEQCIVLQNIDTSQKSFVVWDNV